MNIRDTAERLVWTVVSAFLGALVAGAVITDVSTIHAAEVAGLSAAVNYVSLVARSRLAVLPDPGAGLPKLPTS